MSVTVWVQHAPHPDCTAPHEENGAELDITYNLSPMLREAGFMGWQAVVGRPAVEVGRHILEVLDAMAQDPNRWRAMNPANGWGSYDGCVQHRMRGWAHIASQAHPQDTVGGSL